MVLTWLGVYQTAVTVFTVWVGIRVWRARTDRFQNAALALVLVLFGLMGWGSQGLSQLTTDLALARASQMLLYSLGGAVPFVYLAFIGTLPTPLARPFASGRARAVLLGLAVVATVPAVVSLDTFTTLVSDPGTGLWMPVPQTGGLTLWYIVAAAVFYGFLATISMVRRARRGSPLRTQAVIYAAAFGLRDVWYVTTLLLIPYTVGTPWKRQLAMYQFPSMTLVFTVLLGYGILRYQLLDIDLKIKWAISRTTLATIFIAFYFIVGVTAENFLTTRYGWMAGGVAAGLMLFALTPLQRFAERVADTAMPNVRNDAEYRLVKKREVYRAAYEAAVQDGAVTDRERDILATLQDELGITGTDVLQVEREVRSGSEALLTPASSHREAGRRPWRGQGR